jgi:hypothetical protein
LDHQETEDQQDSEEEVVREIFTQLFKDRRPMLKWWRKVARSTVHSGDLSRFLEQNVRVHIN